MDIGGFRSQLSTNLTNTSDTHVTETQNDRRLSLNQNKDGLVPAKNTFGGRACAWLRDAGIIRSKDPAMVAFKAALKQEMGNDKLAKQLFKKLDLDNHKPLTERRIETAAKYFEQVAAVKDDPMLGLMGSKKFLNALFAVDKNIQANNFNTHGMTTIEKVAVYGYTTSDYGYLNRGLREAGGLGNVQHDGLKSYAQHAVNGLAKLPDATPDPGKSYKTVERGISGFAGIAERYQAGKTVTEHAFTSTSEGRGYDGDWQFTIKSSHGKDVSGLSKYGSEKEILFPPGTQFQVLHVGTTDARDPILGVAITAHHVIMKDV
jgi:hypothetical protein